MVSKGTNQQILGSLMKHPQFLSEIDKYSLSIADFSTRFEKYIFTAIQGLWRNGAPKITAFDIESYIEANDAAKKTFEQQNGLEYLQDIEEFSNVENFPYYYTKLKKLNLLRDLKKQNFPVSDFYQEDLTAPNAAEINQRFEDLTVNDIITEVKKKLLVLESDYAGTEEIQEWDIAEDVDELVDGFGEDGSIGLPIQGSILNKVIDGAQRSCLTIRSGASGTGKALPNSSIIPTPSGWRTVGEIKVGDYLFDAFGKPTKVLNIYPQGKKRVYQVNFKDGRSVRCCNEHLWSYNLSTQKENAIINRKFHTSTLSEILKKGLKNNKAWNILVPMQKAVEYPENEHYLNPYVLGLLLGDGSFMQHETNKSLQYSSEDSFLPEIIAQTQDWVLKKGSDNNYTWYFGHRNPKTRHTNVWAEEALCEHIELLNADSSKKFIPQAYLHDSIENRYALLNGLLDSDGTVDEKGRIRYITNSNQLMNDVRELCLSLGFKITVLVDKHKPTSICYECHISGAPEDKARLFKLPRKKEKILNWYNSEKRKEKNLSNPIVDIVDLQYEEDMTCFYVDNEEHLFLAEDFVVTHNTRNAVADACLLAFPLRYNSATCEWEQKGSNQKVLFIITEQTDKQIKKMILAYLSDINESKFKYGVFTDEEKKVLAQAKQVMKDFSSNFILVRIPNPTIELVKTKVREKVLLHDIGYVFYDYVYIGPALLNEFRGFGIRNDEILLMMATALKDLAVELNVCVFTSTQVNANADNNQNIRNESSLAGGRSTINKADNGAIMARPTKEELETLEPITSTYGKPNLVTDIFKVRSGEWTQVRIWSIVDLGRMRREDLFITDSHLEVIKDFYTGDEYNISDFEDEEFVEIKRKVDWLNGI